MKEGKEDERKEVIGISIGKRGKKMKMCRWERDRERIGIERWKRKKEILESKRLSILRKLTQISWMENENKIRKYEKKLKKKCSTFSFTNLEEEQKYGALSENQTQ